MTSLCQKIMYRLCKISSFPNVFSNISISFRSFSGKVVSFVQNAIVEKIFHPRLWGLDKTDHVSLLGFSTLRRFGGNMRKVSFTISIKKMEESEGLKRGSLYILKFGSRGTL